MTRGLLAGMIAVLALAGCKKQADAPPPPPLPTRTPVPDRDLIGFTRGGQLWVMRWDGGSPAPLAARRDASFWFPSASPKGADFLAWVSTKDGAQNVVRVELDGRVLELTSIEDRAASPMKNLRLGNAPAYDSKAERIAYSHNGNIWIMNRDGENAETLVADGASYAPAWSPDDRKIAYVNGKDGRYDLWVTDVDSRDTYQVTDFSGYTVGGPRWTAQGKRIMMTRSRKDESDIVAVLAETEQPLVDADVLVGDNLSAAAVSDPDAKHLLFSSARKSPPQWEIWVSDPTGKDAKMLGEGGGVSPAWLRPSAQAAPAVAAAAPRPTAVPPTPIPAPTAAPTAAPTQAAAAPTPVPPTAVPTAAPAQPTAVAAQPPTPMPRPTQPSLPVGAKPAPTQPPLKAPPLRLRLRASFDENGALNLASLPELKKAASRMKQYAGETIQVFGPSDRSPLKGRFASEEERSRARAAEIAALLAKEAGLDPKGVQSLPYAPVAVGSQAANGIQIYVVLK